jgi:hypothetical protein
MGVDGQCHTPATLPQGKETWYPLYKRLGGPQGQSGWLRKISPLVGFIPHTVHPIMNHSTDYAVLTLDDFMNEIIPFISVIYTF